MNPTEVQWQIIKAYLVASVLYDEFFVSATGVWTVWIRDFDGPVVFIYPDGKVKRVKDN